MYDVTVIGAAVLDVLARPVEKEALLGRSSPAECITMSVGGDAANEAVTLARLGKRVNLITKLGADLTGKILLQYFQELGISMEDSVQEENLDTGINIVLVEERAERSFITNKNGSLRRLGLGDIPPGALGKSPLVCFASIFVSPLFDTPSMAALFKRAKEQGCTLCADMTRCKNGERLPDIQEAIQYLDYLFPNYEEARAVTGKEDLDEAADAFLACGVSCIVIKTGAKGCLIKTRETRLVIPACPGTSCIDTTGAGDNFAAGFLYALSENMSLEDCGRFANGAASLAVETVGACTGVRSLSQVLERMERIRPQGINV
ncbi:MAG: carbohydrate kinase family protein [Eubacteriales bacterium]|nr:carbohydrate kinase family protein [Eubacteriales bacterium]